ncbi:unnamed protein product [Psylliodes chrysocephalus]|uniref:Uncharacterized protein n=1 Tax=Psylliodes chrysocephalus TaxID=3402493 RepID=A0A9P0D6H9_9CUCU|nr:unnamed protein product [Psylliodes chrysocephala]
MTDNISKLLKENKKAREKIVETFLDKTNVPQEEEVDVFYRSIALSVKRLSPHLIAKLRHLETINELQLLASQPQDLPQQQNRSLAVKSRNGKGIIIIRINTTNYDILI